MLVTDSERPGGFDKQHDGAAGGGGLVRSALGHYEDPVLPKRDGPLPAVFAKSDVDGPVKHEEELVGVAVHMPDVLADEAGKANVVVVEVGDDARRPGVGERGEDVLEIEGLAHGPILCVALSWHEC